MHFDRPKGLFDFIVKYSSMTIHLFNSVSVVTHKLVELNKTCMATILKALSAVINGNRRNKVSTLIKQLKCESTVKTLLIELIYSYDLHFNVTSESNICLSERC